MINNRSLCAVFFVSLLTAFLLVCVRPVVAQEAAIQLTPEEQAWLAEHPIVRIAPDPNFAPLDFIDKQGLYSGLSSYFMKEIEKLTGITFQVITTQSWDESSDAVKTGQADMHPLGQTEEIYSENYLFSETYAFTQRAIISNQHTVGKYRLEDLAGKELVVVKDFPTGPYVLENYPEIKLIEVLSTAEGVSKVAIGEYDFMYSGLPDMAYYIRETGAAGLRLADVSETKSNLAAVVRNDWPELVSIINKALALIPEDRKESIYTKWVSLERSQVEGEIILTPEEKAWLKEHPEVTLGFSPEFEPLIIVGDDGTLSGILIEIYDELERLTGMNINIELNEWSHTIQKAKNGEIDGLLVSAHALVKSIGLSHSHVLTTGTPTVFAKKDAPFEINSEKDLAGKKISVLKGIYIVEQTLKPYKDKIEIIEVESAFEMMKMVYEGKVDAAFGLSYHNYLIGKHILIGIEPVYVSTKFDASAVATIRAEWPEFVSIMNKGLDVIGKARLNEIAQKWTQVKAEFKVTLTEQEKAWLADHPVIRVANEMDWPPLSFVRGGEPLGFSVDYLDLIAQSVGLKVEYVFGYTWNELLDLGRNKKIDLLHSIIKTEDRSEYLKFSKSYLKSPSVVYMKRGSPKIRSIMDILDKRISVVKGYYHEEIIRKLYPEVELNTVGSTLDGLKAVSFGQTDAFIDEEVVGNYIIKSNMLTNVEPVGPHGLAGYEEIALRFAARKDWPILVSILEKGMGSISENEKYQLINKWTTLSKRSALQLTDEEKAWLAEHKNIRLGIDPAFPPFEYFDTEGNFQGLSSSYVQMIKEQIGLEMTPVKALKWDEVIKKAKAGNIDILSAAMKSEKRLEYLNFTKPHTTIPMVILMREDDDLIKGIEDLQNRRVATIKGYITETLLQNDFPEFTYIRFDTMDEALLALSRGTVDAFIGNIATISYTSQKLVLDNLRVAAPTDYKWELAFGVRKDWPELIPILNKFIESIPSQEKQAIEQGWLNLRVEKQIDYSLIWKLVLGAALLLAIFLYWNRWLSREVTKRKQAQAAMQEAKEHVDNINIKLQMEVDERIKVADELKKSRDASQKRADELVEARRSMLNMMEDLDTAKDSAEYATRAKSDFLANMSHELRTPLNSILGFSDVIKRGMAGPVNDAQKEYLTDIHESGEFLLDLINDILDLSKVEAGKMELDLSRFDLKSLIEGSKVMFKEKAMKHRIKVTLDVDDIIGEINADERKIKQLLFNLISNAIKFTPDGGSVCVRAHISEDKKDLVEVSVEDSGVGISPEDQKKLFQPFKQLDSRLTKEHKGTGLGLNLCKKIVELHRGKIWVESEVGKGSKFTFVIPGNEANI